MKNFHFGPYEVTEMWPAIKRLGELTNTPCRMHEVPELERQGFKSPTAFSEDLVRIATKYGIPSSFSGNVESVAHQLQSLIDALVSKGIVKYEDF